MNEQTIGTEASPLAENGPPRTFEAVVDDFCLTQAKFRAELALMGGGPADGPREGPFRDRGAREGAT